MKKLVQKNKRQESAQADIVASILILAITVALFSGVLYWVWGMPAPTAEAEATFETFFYKTDAVNTYRLNITHKGGEELFNATTRIHISINLETPMVKFITDSVEPIGTSWTTGEIWRYNFVYVDTIKRVSVAIIDIYKNVVIWSADNILRTLPEYAPIIMDRYTLPTPVVDGEAFRIYVKVWDPNNNLATVKIESPTTGQYVDMHNPSGDCTTFVSPWPTSYTGNYNTMRGKVLKIRVTDTAGNLVTSTITLNVVRYVIEYTNVTGGTGNVVEDALAQSSGLQRYDIFNATEWDTKGWNAQATRTFKRGEKVVVVVASKYLVNVEEINKFYLYNTSGIPPTPIVYSGTLGPTSTPSCTNAFSFYSFTTGYYCWLYRFSTDANNDPADPPLSYGRYPLEIELKSSVATQPNRFWVQDTINVTDQDGNLPDYPQILTFKNAAHTIPSVRFNFTETVYVKIVVQDTDGTFDIGDVVIKDFSGGIQIWAKPGNPPVSTAYINNTRSYAFSIDLSRPNIDRWLFGTNDYTLSVKSVTDANEAYALSTQVEITGPRWYLDITAGLNGWKEPAWDRKEYLNFYPNGVTWGKTPLATYIGPAGQEPYGNIYETAFGDVDADSDLDIIATSDKGHVLYYRNEDGAGTNWREYALYGEGGIGGSDWAWSGKKVDALAVGHTDKDNDADIVIGTETGEVWHIANDGHWSARLIDSVGSYIYNLRLADVTGDGFDDIVLGAANGNVYIYFNNGDGIFGDIQKTNYTMIEDTVTAPGTRSGSYADTTTENGVCEALTEAWITAYVTVVNKSVGEIKTDDYVVGGDHTYTHLSDDTRETLTEFDKNPGAAVQYVIDSAATPRGHIYNMSNINVPPGSTVYLRVECYLNLHDEDFRFGWSTDGTKNTLKWPGWIVTATTETTYEWSLSADGFTGGSLYIHVDDTDKNDGTTTTIFVDYLHVDVVQPGGSTSALQHIWKTDVVGAGGTVYKFFIRANHTPNTENDDFEVSWSLNKDGPYSKMTTVTYTTFFTYVYTFSSSEASQIVGNNVYIKIVDTDRTVDNLKNDTINVDCAYIQRITVSPRRASYTIGDDVYDVAVGNIDAAGLNDIIAVSADKKIYLLKNLGGSPPSFSVVALATDPNGAEVRSVGIGHITNAGGTGNDNYLDVVAGNAVGAVYIYVNDGSGGVARTIQLEDGLIGGNNIGVVQSIRVGDVNGDWWDDVVIGTNKALINYYVNLRTDGTSWLQELIDDEIAWNAVVWCVDIGDVDRGITV